VPWATQFRLDETPEVFVPDVAIVGIGCRYAGGIDSPDSFWDFVVKKKDGVVDIPADRWDYRRYYDKDKRTPGRMYTRRAAFMTIDPWEFDPEFFGISAGLRRCRLVVR
jgi:acyl transferase domain-containing protein